MRIFFNWARIGLLALILIGCSDSNDNGNSSVAVAPANESAVFSVANGCFAISTDSGSDYLAANASGAQIHLVGDGAQDVYLLRPSDLGKYLLYDQDKGYLVSDGLTLQRQMSLAFDMTEVDGKVVVERDMQSEGEWQLRAATNERFLLLHIKSGTYIGRNGSMVEEADAAKLTFFEANDCAVFPELSLDATGDISVTEFEDGSVFGFVDTHSHLFTNLAFGGGGVFHGAPFHPLGVEHALHDCDLSHGADGRRDFIGAGFSADKVDAVFTALITGLLPEKNHNTEGYPIFTDWPNAASSSTHQVQYYTWLQRAYLSGLRLLVQHATTNEFLCQLAVGAGAQTKRHACNDMVNVDEIINATYQMERYIDALAGGPEKGWFRIVFSPEEARAEIKAGNLAVVLGIETSVLFDCFLVPPAGFDKCTESDVSAKLDEYYEKGVRVLFPSHKYDNGFSSGDGHRGIIDIGNFGHTGHYNSYIECPAELLAFPGGFDKGGLAFPGLNQPRDVYDSPPPVDMSDFENDPVGRLLPYAALLTEAPLSGEYCQKHGLTKLGEFLIVEMMKRGIIIEVDHLPRLSYQRAYELLEANDYPAMGTHGRNNNGKLYKLGGMSKSNFGRCRSAESPGSMDDGFQSRIQLMKDMGAFPAEGFGFDLNGFAGAAGPRFGDNAGCADPQTDEGITYPFKSYAGDITLNQPWVGERMMDFNTQGMTTLGQVAELIQEVRADGATDTDLEPLFKSAEGYIRVWEKSERRAEALRQ